MLGHDLVIIKYGVFLRYIERLEEGWDELALLQHIRSVIRRSCVVIGGRFGLTSDSTAGTT